VIPRMLPHSYFGDDLTRVLGATSVARDVL
jgi:hypothetical protein